jgi:segregation and condensation protein A
LDVEAVEPVASGLLPPPVQLTLQLEGFEGPLELLLTLIEQHRLPITEISLASVADQYLEQVRALPELDADLLADFLVIGARLLLLKSRALLVREEPDEEVRETAADLERRLAEYRVFRAAAEHLRQIEERDERSYGTSREPLQSLGEAPLAPLSPMALRTVWLRFQRRDTAPMAELPPPRASVDACRTAILAALKHAPTASFRSFAGTTVDAVVAAFLAVLELMRRGLIVADQPEPFGDVTLSRPGPAR